MVSGVSVRHVPSVRIMEKTIEKELQKFEPLEWRVTESHFVMFALPDLSEYVCENTEDNLECEV